MAPLRPSAHDDRMERLVPLGATVEGSCRVAARLPNLPELPLALAGGKQPIAAPSWSPSVDGKPASKTRDQSADLPTANTADAFTIVSRGMMECLAFVPDQAQADRQQPGNPDGSAQPLKARSYERG